MSSAVNDGQYQGSQAFAHVLPVKGESINPNTGSLSFSKPLVELRGIRPSVDLKINLTYSAGTSGAFGLPRAWALDIPYVVPGKSVTTQGRTYAIDLGWTDDSNYQSGLRYLNNHGMKFEPVVPPQQLPSGHSGEYSYKLQHPDGSIDYFEANGKPLERDDIYGNFIYYGLTASAGGSVLSSEPCLEYILDSWGQKITFEYMPATRMDLVSPDGSRVSANFSEQGVDQITDAAGYQTRCWYTAFNNNQQVLHEIGYPTNLVSRYDYCGLGYFDADHNAKQMPAVQDHYRLDRDGRLLEHTNYSYGTETGGLTYTGAGKGFTMGGLQDTLMEGGDPEYRYDGLKTSLDSSGNTLAAASTVFNYLHLPIEECKYTVDGQAGVRKAFGTTYTYEVSPNKHARTASYAYPTITEQSHNTSLGPGEIWMPLNRTIKAYNPFGNVIRTDVELCSKDSFWIKQKTLAKEYYATKAGIQIPESETVKDEISGSIHLTRNTLCGNEKAIESSTILFTSGQGSSPPETWKIKSYAYDQFGRIIQERLSWAQGAAVPPGSAPSTTRLMEYSLDRGILTESSVDSSENITKVEYDLRKLGGPIVRRTLPMGQIEGFEYDLVGRLVKHTDFLKAVTKTEYNVGGPTNTVKTTSPTGYVEMKMFDALGRVCEVMDNANPTTTLQIPGRTLQRTKYDGRGRLVETTSRFGLITRQSYDALDRQISKTDPLGNVTEYYHDDTHLRVRETLNGDLRKLIQLDGAAQAISETNFADSSDTSVNYCVTVDTIWDGNKRKMNEVTSEKPKGVFNTAAVRKLKQDRKVYDADSLVAFHSMEGLGESGNDIVERQLCRDLFGNVHSYSKKTTYAGGRSYSHNGPVKIYSADNKFVKLQNQLGQEESYHFDQNSWLQKTVRFDGTQITYSRDACGQTTEIVYPTSKTELTYDWKDRLSDVQDGTQKISYEYFLDGALKSTQFGDDRRQTYKLDKTSRIVEEVDVFGVAREYQYDQHGRLSEVSCQGDKLSYVYGVANHTNGQLLGAQLDGKRFIQHFRSYDGFGSTKEVRIQESDSSMLLEATYLMNSRGQLHYANIKSTTCPELNSGRTMLYDGIGQLIQEAKTGSVKSTTSYSYDVLEMAYNEIDQRVDSGIQYDKNGRMTHNSRGHSYTFDDKDHLVSVSLSIDSEDQFFYHADDSLASCKESQSTTNFFHSQKRINALETINAEGGLDENSLLTGLDQLIASYSSSKEPTYFLENSGSTTIILQQHEVTAFTYQPYGKQRASKPITQSLLNFGFTQAFTHQSSELIYLRSRHYDPNIMAFLSMDSDYTKENRYAYCEGDPVNYSDPSGHVRSWKWLAVGVGLGLGVLAGVTTGGLALGAIEIWWGTEIATSSVVANFVVAGVSGAFTNVATNAGTALTEYLLPGGPPQIDYGWRRALSDFVVGGGSGMLGVGATLTVGEAARQFTINILGRYIRQGAGVAVAQFSFEQLQHPDEHPNLEELTQSIAIGVVGALIGGHYARQGGQGAGRQRLLSADGQDARTRATTADSLSVELIEKGRLAKFRRHGGDDDHGDSLA